MRTMNIIEELYYGNIDPQESGFERDESVHHELRTIIENEDWLAEHLTGEEKERFLDLCQCLDGLQRRLHSG